jgi:hypothetical protein
MKILKTRPTEAVTGPAVPQTSSQQRGGAAVLFNLLLGGGFVFSSRPL